MHACCEELQPQIPGTHTLIMNSHLPESDAVEITAALSCFTSENVSEMPLNDIVGAEQTELAISR